MTSGSGTFLTDFLPAQGPYWMIMYRCDTGMVHESFDSLKRMAARIEELNAYGVEVWHAVASYAHRHDATKAEAEAEGGERWGRKRANVAYLTAFFLDIDVDPGKLGKAYRTIEEAKEALAQFEKAFGEPYGYLVHSGGGLHVYWSLSEHATCSEWERIAFKFKDATKIAGLLADPSRTADPTSLLRPVGTINRKLKYGASGRPVEGIWNDFGSLTLEAFEAACDRVLGGGQVIDGSRPPTTPSVRGIALAPAQPRHWFDDLTADIKLQALRTMLAALPAECVTDRAQWIAVGGALAGVEQMPRDALFNLWVQWSQSTEGGAVSWRECPEEEHRRRWDGLNRSGVGALIIRAKDAGWSSDLLRNSADGQAAFHAVVDAQDVNGERHTKAQMRAYLDENVIFVKAESQYLLDGLLVSKEALDTSLARRMPITRPQITASGLLKGGAGLIVDHIGYKPGATRTYVSHDRRKFANSWQPHLIVPTKPTLEEAQIFAAFVKHLGGGNDETKAGIKRITTKLAFLFANPSARIRHATLLIGKAEGCGKSTITCAIPRVLFGDANVRSVETRELSSEFNGYAQGARILVFPELWLGSRKDAQTQANNLKPLITDDYIPVVRKGKDGRNVENCTTIFASSNYADAAVFNGRDRRYDVIMTDAPRMPTELAEHVYALINNRPGALLWLVLRFGKDADSFDPHAAPPQTAAKRAMMEAGRGDWAQLMHDESGARNWPFSGDAVAVSDVKLLLGSEYQPQPSDRAIHQELLSMGDGAYCVLAQRRQRGIIQQKRVVVLRNINSWKEAGPTALYAHYDETVVRNRRL